MLLTLLPYVLSAGGGSVLGAYLWPKIAAFLYRQVKP